MSERSTKHGWIWWWTVAGIVLYTAPLWQPALMESLHPGSAAPGFFDHEFNRGWFFICTPAWFVIGTVAALGAMREKVRFSGWWFFLNLAMLLVSLFVAALLLVLTTADPAGSLT